MALITYSSWDRVHGLFCVERKVFDPTVHPALDPKIAYFFFGYKCDQCQDVFLVPDTIKTDYDLQRHLNHDCESKGINA